MLVDVEEAKAQLAELPAVLPFEECPYCFGPVILVKRRLSAVVDCMDCREELARWNLGQTTWRCHPPTGMDADIQAARRSVSRLAGLEPDEDALG